MHTQQLTKCHDCDIRVNPSLKQGVIDVCGGSYNLSSSWGKLFNFLLTQWVYLKRSLPLLSVILTLCTDYSSNVVCATISQHVSHDKAVIG